MRVRFHHHCFGELMSGGEKEGEEVGVGIVLLCWPLLIRIKLMYLRIVCERYSFVLRGKDGREGGGCGMKMSGFWVFFFFSLVYQDKVVKTTTSETFPKPDIFISQKPPFLPSSNTYRGRRGNIIFL